ncbi:MAG: 2-dehydro-3-deoxyphosphooctonate aldolase [Alphaproteobacteria bacterium]|nr:2-dehydro-3-deoxyphosphooctonate aldolase [Alphaproteobacteria bacterium]
MVHGNCVSIGCYAMTDTKIEEIYTLAESALDNGQKSFGVHIFPFHMTDENIKKHSQSEWIDFWNNLKIGYNMFEENKVPPTVSVKNKQYIFKQ